MKNEWKVLDKGNLPSDILTGEYKFKRYFASFDRMEEVSISPYNAICGLEIGNHFEYRKAEPKNPTHIEIMTKWWKDYDGKWYKVTGFQAPNGDNQYIYKELWSSPRSFAKKESADIPLEVES